jgi:hypothetical protein
MTLKEIEKQMADLQAVRALSNSLRIHYKSMDVADENGNNKICLTIMENKEGDNIGFEINLSNHNNYKSQTFSIGECKNILKILKMFFENEG